MHCASTGGKSTGGKSTVEKSTGKKIVYENIRENPRSKIRYICSDCDALSLPNVSIVEGPRSITAPNQPFEVNPFLINQPNNPPSNILISPPKTKGLKP